MPDTFRRQLAPFVPLFLRVGLGLVFLWSAFSKFVAVEGALGVCTNRAEAIDFVSTLYWVPFDPELLVTLQSILELVLGLMLVLGFWLELASAATAAMFGLFFVVFDFNVVWKNLGLLGAALALTGVEGDRWTMDSWLARRRQVKLPPVL